MAYHPSLRETVLSVQRRPDGRTFLRIAGARPVNEPTMELLVLARGGAQPLLRDYTLLIEPRAPRDTPLALGQARVLSARGEPLRAEIDVPQLPQGKSAGTRVALAPAADFQAAGMAYSPGLADIRLSLQRRPDGRTFMSLTSEKPFNETSLDLLLEASSAAGRTVRDYSVPIAPPPIAPTRVSSGLVTPAAPTVALAPVAPPAPAACCSCCSCRRARPPGCDRTPDPDDSSAGRRPRTCRWFLRRQPLPSSRRRPCRRPYPHLSRLPAVTSAPPACRRGCASPAPPQQWCLLLHPRRPRPAPARTCTCTGTGTGTGTGAGRRCARTATRARTGKCCRASAAGRAGAPREGACGRHPVAHRARQQAR